MFFFSFKKCYKVRQLFFLKDTVSVCCFFLINGTIPLTTLGECGDPFMFTHPLKNMQCLP